MKNLKRLKNFLTGQQAEEDEKKESAEETKTPETFEETSDKTEETIESSPAVEKKVETEAVKEEKPETEETEPEATVKEKEAETKTVKEEEPETEEVKAETTTEETEVEVTEEKEIIEEEEETVPEEVETESEVVEKAEKEEEPKTKGSVNMTLLNKEENLVSPEDVDNTFKQDIMDAGADTVALCYQCGTCTGSCPSGKRTPYRIRSIIRKSLMGLRNEVMNDETIWECVTCYACQERCPRGVAIVDVVKVIRNMQSQAGKMAPAHKAVGSFVLKSGHGVPINDATMALRKKVGLGELPPTTHQFPEALKEVQDILKKTQFDTLIGYNWETGELE
ncbi:MAG: CoB--CoM heterodisulfide reductase subunit C [Methanobacterium sp.]|nr:CoB--CoM heterodisulfide reductase subunit C [Methanobacterium sp.]